MSELIIQLLDYLLGHRHEALFRRAELKTLVDLHGNEVRIIVAYYFETISDTKSVDSKRLM
jgi:hypothetical protein